MASIFLEVVAVTPVEGLCAKCFLPALQRVTLGVRNDFSRPVPSSLASQVACDECGWVQ